MLFNRLKKREPSSKAAASSSPAKPTFLLASEGRAYSQEALDCVASLAQKTESDIYILSIARVWGSAFGLPNAALMPTKKEWAIQREHVETAVLALRKMGITVQGRVLGTRNAAKKIVEEAHTHACQAIIMGADQPANFLIQAFQWSQEPHRVKRLAKIDVLLTR